MHIVVNYRSGIVDIFIDGTLRTTENNIQPFMEYSKIYFDKGLSKFRKSMIEDDFS